MIDNSPGNPDLQEVLSKLTANAAKEERAEPGPGDAAPTAETKVPTLVTMEMSEEEVQQWWARVQASDDRIRTEANTWDVLLKEYLPIVKASGEAESVKIPKHFRNVHSKIGQLFYKTPEPVLLPKDPSPAQNELPNPLQAQNPMLPLPPIKMEDIISVKQAVLSYQMGPERIDYGWLMDELLFDVLAWTGIGCSKIGYTCVTKPVEEPVMGPDPNWMPPPMPGGMLGLGPTPEPPLVPQMHPQTGEPLIQTVQVPIYEEFYERRFSPKKLIINADLRSTRHDQDATMMGMHFYMGLDRAKNLFQLTDAEIPKTGDDEKVYQHEGSKAVTVKNDLVHGVELWVRACYFSEERHPQVLYQVILLEGLTRAVVYRMSPDQTLDEMGRLTEDSLIGFPIKVLTVRDLADSPFPPADSAFTNGEIKQLTTWRRQSVMMRDAAIGHYLYDSGAFDEEQLKLLKSNTPGRYIPVEPGQLKENGGKGVLDITSQVHQTADDVRNQQIFSKDIDETLGIGSVQSGTTEDTVRTATELANVQAAVAGRNGKELGRTVRFYLDSCRKLDQLLMRYATEDDYIHITGEDGARRMMVWNNQVISGRYIYEIAPDSQMQVDTAKERQQTLNFYNLTANDPMVNRAYLLRRLARQFSMDPMKVILPSAQWMPGMSPLDMESAVPPSMAPGGGGAPAVGSQPPHGGAATPGAAISKHVASNSGGRPNEPGAGNQREGRV